MRHENVRVNALGCEIEAGRSGPPEIKGYTQEYFDVRDSRFEREAAVDERLIFRDAPRRGKGEQPMRRSVQIRVATERGDFRSVEAANYATARIFTTSETIAAARVNIRHVLEGGMLSSR